MKMKKNDQNVKTSKRAAQILVEVKPDELQSVTGGSCRTCGLIVSAS
jgi:hypothetical protein